MAKTRVLLTCKTTINFEALASLKCEWRLRRRRWKKLLTTKAFCIYNSVCFSVSLEILLIDLLITKLQQSSVGFLLLSLATKSFEGHGTLNISALPPKAALQMAVDCEGNKTLAVSKTWQQHRAENEESPRSKSRRKQIKRNFVFVSKKNKKFSRERRSSCPSVWLGDSYDRRLRLN